MKGENWKHQNGKECNTNGQPALIQDSSLLGCYTYSTSLTLPILCSLAGHGLFFLLLAQNGKPSIGQEKWLKTVTREVQMSGTAGMPTPVLCCAVSPLLYNWCLLSLYDLSTFSLQGAGWGGPWPSWQNSGNMVNETFPSTISYPQIFRVLPFCPWG